jgi:mRNA interferase MazF
MIFMSMTTIPRRGEIWLVDFDPSIGAEIQKVRTAVVMSVNRVARLPLRVVVPLTDWKPQYVGYPWFVHIIPNPSNGLVKDSGADAFQVKSVSETRFVRCLGSASTQEIDAIANAIALVVGKPQHLRPDGKSWRCRSSQPHHHHSGRQSGLRGQKRCL